MAKKKAIGDNPLFETVSDEITQEEHAPQEETSIPDAKTVLDEVDIALEHVKAIRREAKKHEVKERRRDDSYMRMTFIIRRDLMAKLRDYCFTERISQKEGLERALLKLFDDVSEDELIQRPERD